MAKPKVKASATVEKWAFDKNGEIRAMAIVRQSIQELTEEVQTPVAKGGHMRVDTGFLRASGNGSLTGMPTGPSRRPDQPEDGPQLTYDDGSPVPNSVSLTLAQMKAGDTFWFGWTANYAKFREAKDGFLRLGVQRWQTIVNGVAARLRKQVGE